MNGGVPPLQGAARDLAVTARLIYGVMEIVRKRADISVREIAQEVQASEADVRRTLFALEAVGLVESTHYRVTVDGRSAK